MANEINIQAGLTVQRSTIAVQGQGNKFISPTGTRVGQNQISATTTWAATTLIASGVNAAYVFIKNANTSGAETLDVAYGNNSEIFASLKADEFCFLPLRASTTQLYFHASASTITVLFVAAEG